MRQIDYNFVCERKFNFRQWNIELLYALPHVIVDMLYSVLTTQDIVDVLHYDAILK